MVAAWVSRCENWTVIKGDMLIAPRCQATKEGKKAKIGILKLRVISKNLFSYHSPCTQQITTRLVSSVCTFTSM